MPKKETVFAIIENSEGEVLLQQRPPSGIWGGLWCFPEFSTDEFIVDRIKQQFGFKIRQQTEYKHIKHTFSHFHLMIRPVHIKLAEQATTVNENGLLAWLNPGKDSNLGFPAPVVSMLDELNNNKMVEI